MRVPDWWGFVLLGLASFRIWRILAVDTILEGVRNRLFRWEDYQGGAPERYRYGLDEFVKCPWCFGWWVVLGWWGLWQVWEHAVYVMSVPLALSTVVGYLAKWD
jgi:hypothetical protein